jgi:hypothetical protein
MNGIQTNKAFSNRKRRGLKTYKRVAATPVKVKDLPVSDIIERVLNRGIILDRSIRRSGNGVDLITKKSRVVIASDSKAHLDEKRSQA